MSLKDIRDQVDRDHPEWTNTQKMMLIKELRQREKADTAAAAQTGAPQPITVRQAWILFLIVAVGMRLSAYSIWGSFTAEPRWYDVLYAVGFILAVLAVVGAYRRR